jgi:mRNA interferase MazF
VGRRYVPEAGDVVWLHFDPQAGHEQAGRRPALVLSSSAYNGKTGLMLCCPMTTQIKGYPFEVRIAGNRASAVLADQIKSLDWVVRSAGRKGKVSAAELEEVRAKVFALIGTPHLLT